MEHIVQLLDDDFEHPGRFLIEMAGITYPDASYHVYRSDSEIYCFEYVIEGQGNISCGAETFTASAGDAYLLPARTRHDYRSLPSDPMKKIWANIRGTLCDALYEEYGLGNRFLYPGQNLYGRFRELLNMCEHHRHSSPDIEVKASLLVHEMFALLSPSNESGASENGHARQAKAFIDRHVADKLSAKYVAERLGISPSQLSRVFVAQYGVPPMKYHADQRIKSAQNLLRNTGLQIKEVAAFLNYTDVHYFSSSFRKSTGMSPREYRLSSKVSSDR